MVRTAGLEPARSYEPEILSLVRLPFRQARDRVGLIAYSGETEKAFIEGQIMLSNVLPFVFSQSSAVFRPCMFWGQ